MVSEGGYGHEKMVSEGGYGHKTMVSEGDMDTKLVDPFICLLLFENSRLPKSRKNPPKNYPISSEPWAHWLTNRMGHYHSQNLTKPNWSHNEVT